MQTRSNGIEAAMAELVVGDVIRIYRELQAAISRVPTQYAGPNQRRLASRARMSLQASMSPLVDLLASQWGALPRGCARDGVVDDVRDMIGQEKVSADREQAAVAKIQALLLRKLDRHKREVRLLSREPAAKRSREDTMRMRALRYGIEQIRHDLKTVSGRIAELSKRSHALDDRLRHVVSSKAHARRSSGPARGAASTAVRVPVSRRVNFEDDNDHARTSVVETQSSEKKAQSNVPQSNGDEAPPIEYASARDATKEPKSQQADFESPEQKESDSEQQGASGQAEGDFSLDDELIRRMLNDSAAPTNAKSNDRAGWSQITELSSSTSHSLTVSSDESGLSSPGTPGPNDTLSALTPMSTPYKGLGTLSPVGFDAGPKAHPTASHKTPDKSPGTFFLPAWEGSTPVRTPSAKTGLVDAR